MTDSIKLVYGKKEYELPVVEGSEGEKAIDISQLRATTGLITLDPGYAMGLWSAKLSVRVVTGHLQGTHGGLDRESTLGFYLSNDPDQPPGDAITAEQTLADLKPYAPLPVVWPEAEDE